MTSCECVPDVVGDSHVSNNLFYVLTTPIATMATVLGFNGTFTDGILHTAEANDSVVVTTVVGVVIERTPAAGTDDGAGGERRRGDDHRSRNEPRQTETHSLAPGQGVALAVPLPETHGVGQCDTRRNTTRVEAVAVRHRP